MTITAATSRPSVGLLTIGRSRPGFDPQWGRQIQHDAEAAMRALPWPVVVPAAAATDEESLRRAVAQLRQSGCEGLVVIQPTMGDGRLIAALTQLWTDPLVLWATTERPDSDRVSACTLVGAHLFASILRQMHHPYEIANGHPSEPATRAQLELSLRLTLARTRLRRARIGFVGAHAPGFLNLHVDPAMIRTQLGSVVHHMGLQEFIDTVRGVDAPAVQNDRREIDALSLPRADDIPEEALELTSRYTLAIRNIIAEQRLDGLAIRCWPELPNVLGAWPYFAFARLADEGAVLAMEGDVDGALTLLLGRLMGYGPGYLSDWLAHDQHTLQLWHQGEAPLSLSDRSTVAMARHFNNDKPLVLNAQLAADREITLARLWHCDGRYLMTAVDARTAVPPRRLRGTVGLAVFDNLNVPHWFDRMVHEGLPHHLALFSGSRTHELRRLARQLDIRWVESASLSG